MVELPAVTEVPPRTMSSARRVMGSSVVAMLPPVCEIELPAPVTMRSREKRPAAPVSARTLLATVMFPALRR